MGFFDFLSRKKSTESPPKSPSSSSLWSRIKGLFSSSTQVDEELIEELEALLLSADVGPKMTHELIEALEKELLQSADFPHLIIHLKEQITERLRQVHTLPSKSISTPHILLIVGVNGVGKTTSIGKLAHHYVQKGKRVLLAAADTFRAAAPEQLTQWAERAHVEILNKGMHQDPSSVAYEALQKAQDEAFDIVLIDTAGRLHTKVPLMNQLAKIKRVIQKFDPTAPHEVLLVIDGTTGQNAWQQAELFKEAAGVTGLVITKLDSLAKGGILIGLTTELSLPVRYLGFGEKIEDLKPFEVEDFVARFFEGNKS